MKTVTKKIIVVLFSVLFMYNSIIITNVEASNTEEIPDSFTYYDNGAYWKISNIYDLENLKLELLFTVGGKATCFPGDPCYPYCNCSNPDLGNKRDDPITKFLDCVVMGLKRNIIGDISFYAITKSARAVLIKYGKAALAKHLVKIIPGVNSAYVVKLLYDSSYGCLV